MTILKSFCAALAVLLVGCAQTEPAPDFSATTAGNTFYELRIYDAAPGKLDDLHARFRDHTIRFFERHGIESIGYWVPIENEENQLYFIIAYPDREAREERWGAFASDPDWIEARAASEVDGRLVSRAQSIFLTPTDYSPVITPRVSATPRLFEFRTYVASPGNLDLLHARFRDHTIGLFSKHGIEHFGYWSPVDADKGAGTTLMYFMSHDSHEARDASFTAFRSDPDWLAAREASEVAGGGSLTTSVEPILMVGTDYSPTR